MKRVFVFAVLMIALAVQSTWAQAPQTMSYQGVLNDGSGQPVADDSYALAFAIYTTSGSQLWTELHGGVATKGGVFSVILGSQGTPLNLAFDQAYELGIAVNGGPEMTPRIPLASAPYSLNTRAISQVSGSTVISNPARILESGGLTIEESGETGRTLALTPPGVSTAASLNANSVNGLKVETAGPMGLFTGGGERITISQNGSVSFPGIAEGLTLVGEDPFPTTNRDTRFIRVVDVNDTGGQPDGDLVIEGYTTSDNGRTPLMTIRGNDGRIGFGTYDPVEVLGGSVRMRVKGPGHIFVDNNYGLFSLNSAGTGWGAGVDTEVDDSLLFYTAGISQPDFYIATDSKIGIGTKNVTSEVGNAAVRVGIDGHIIVNRDFGFYSVHSSGSGFGAGVDTHSDNSLRLVTDGANRVFVTASGAMGVGIENPVGLHVNLPEGSSVTPWGVSLSGGSSGEANIELRGQGAYIDFSDDNHGDFDMRLRLINSNTLAYSGGALVDISDRRLKENIRPLKSALEKLSQLKGYTYNFKEGVYNETEPSQETLGLIAQEVEKIYPQLVTYSKELDRYHLDYNGIIPVLVEGTKELKAQVDQQKAEITQLKAMLNGLVQRVAEMEKEGDTATVKRTSTNSME